MTDKDKSTIQRMLGKIEAVAFVVDDKFQTPLLDALEVLDAIFDRYGDECVKDVFIDTFEKEMAGEG